MRCPGWPCDTPHAIDPAIWRVNSRNLTPGDLAFEIAEVGVKNVCWTGGEPFTQNEKDLHLLMSMLRDEDFTVEVFTNGSIDFPPWAISLVHFTMDWKLKGSGEADFRRPTRFHNASRLKRSDDIKFVVKDNDDLLEAYTVAGGLRDKGFRGGFYLGAAWGCITDDELVRFLLSYKLDWKLNVQVHKHIWEPDQRGV
jgi:7-carboxy-7-deazaguanine synthase